MKLIFVDAENIGLRQLEEINSAFTDRVFVFSKDDSVKVSCEEKSFLVMSAYPTGPNQADFYIIAKLVALIGSMSLEQTKSCEFVLYSQDNALVSAFSFQCRLHKMKFKIALNPKSNPAQKSTAKKLPLEEKLLSILSSPTTSEDAREKLKANKSDFTRAINRLIADNKIHRSSESKKKWQRIVQVVP